MTIEAVWTENGQGALIRRTDCNGVRASLHGIMFVLLATHCL